MMPYQWVFIALIVSTLLGVSAIVYLLIRDYRKPRPLYPLVGLGGAALIIMDRRPSFQWEYDWGAQLLPAMKRLGWDEFAPVTCYYANNIDQAVTQIDNDTALFMVVLFVDPAEKIAELGLADRTGKQYFSLSRTRLSSSINFVRWLDGLNRFGMWDEMALTLYRSANRKIYEKNFADWKARQP